MLLRLCNRRHEDTHEDIADRCRLGVDRLPRLPGLARIATGQVSRAGWGERLGHVPKPVV